MKMSCEFQLTFGMDSCLGQFHVRNMDENISHKTNISKVIIHNAIYLKQTSIKPTTQDITHSHHTWIY